MDERRIRHVALTGGIATGKSHVRSRFEALGVPTIDADSLARDAIAPGTAGFRDVIRRFGTDVQDSRGLLDRKKLGAIVFADQDARRDLEQIVHPFVRDMTNRWFSSLDATRHPFAVADIPLLFEGKREGEFDAVIVTACEPETQLKRLMNRDGLTQEEARQRIATQLPLAAKVANADYVVRTDGSMDETDRQVDAVMRQLTNH